MVDSREGDGGFCCVPGFTNHLSDYAEKTKKSSYATKKAKEYSFVNVHPNDFLNSQTRKITSRAGSLVVWSSELPHCNYPNDSNKWRFNLYVKLFPSKEGAPGTELRKNLVENYTKDIKVTPLGRKLFGLENYE